MKPFNWRFVSFIIGVLLLIESAFLAITTLVALYHKGGDVEDFFITTLLTLLFGGGLVYRMKDHPSDMHKREGFFIVSVSWVALSIFGMIPFVISGAIPSITDAFFETMSGFTTTGASILNDIESLPRGILFWRSIIQWLGGMGIIVFTLALLPMLGINGGVHLFNSEAPGLTHDKLSPRIDQTAKRLWGMYLAITAVLAGLLYLGPMDMFDSVCHAFTTMATGGFSTKQASIAHWDSAYIEYLLTLFMFIAGTNFTLVYFLINGRFKKLKEDEEFRFYVGCVVCFSLFITAVLLWTGVYSDVEYAFRTSLFQVVSLMTTTGFATADFIVWGTLFWVLMLIIMLPGGSAGSTSGGMKMIRVIVLIKNTLNEFKRQVHPNAILPVRINKTVVPYDLVTKVLAFMFIYLMIILVSALFLTALGTGFEEAIGSVITSISNVGPGLGETGPAGNFANLHPVAKWYLSFVMLVGRLELFTVLTILSPTFWRE
ncbi:MAG: TrkH family potassium uptake protein [Bacteroidales bacterium]